jgi:hypothetical protein
MIEKVQHAKIAGNIVKSDLEATPPYVKSQMTVV